MSSIEGQGTGRRWRTSRGDDPEGQAGSTRSLTETGLRRVDWVRLVVDHDSVSAEAVGVGYRLPASRPIPLPVAAALIAGGTPSVTRTFGDRPVDAARGHSSAGRLDAGR
jgi:hypothetical protein